jgi:hypothetical protein
MAIRVVGYEEGKGGKAMAMATRAAGKRTAMAKTRAMVMATREAGEKEGNGKGNKSINGKEDGNGERQL